MSERWGRRGRSGVTVTLIALIRRPDRPPYLLADLLVSSDTGRRFHLPTIGDFEPSPIGAFKQPDSLVQKIARVGPRCAVAFAGNPLGARDILRELREMHDRGMLRPPFLKSFFAGLGSDVSVRQSTTALAIFNDAGQFYDYVHGDTDAHSSDDYVVHLAGSGKNHCIFDRDGAVVLDQDGRPKRLFPHILQRTIDVTRHDHPLCEYMGIQSTLIAIEHGTQDTIQHTYGGGFEIACFLRSGEVRKLDVPTYVYKRFDLDDDNTIISVIQRTGFDRYSRTLYFGNTLGVVNFDISALPTAAATPAHTAELTVISDLVDAPSPEPFFDLMRRNDGVLFVYGNAPAISLNLLLYRDGQFIDNLCYASAPRPHPHFDLRRVPTGIAFEATPEFAAKLEHDIRTWREAANTVE